MDAITNEGFTIANFTDTSGNPSAAKVYRAARIILQQPGLCGYFGSGSGVAAVKLYVTAGDTGMTQLSGFSIRWYVATRRTLTCWLF